MWNLLAQCYRTEIPAAQNWRAQSSSASRESGVPSGRPLRRCKGCGPHGDAKCLGRYERHSKHRPWAEQGLSQATVSLFPLARTWKSDSASPSVLAAAFSHTDALLFCKLTLLAICLLCVNWCREGKTIAEHRKVHQPSRNVKKDRLIPNIGYI